LIRKAAPGDIPAIISVALRALGDQTPLRIDAEKIATLVTTAVSAAAHFAWVSEQDGQVSGALVGLSYDLPWAERRGVDIMLLWAEVPMDGWRMLRELKSWFLGRRALKVITVSLKFRDERVYSLLERIGLVSRGRWLMAHRS